MSTSVEVSVPESILFDSVVFSMDFSPVQDVIACGLVDGTITCHFYSVQGNKQVFGTKPHKKAIRGLQLSPDGTGLFSTSSDKSVNMIDLNTGQITWHQPRAHDNAINCMLLADKNVFTGDDNGIVQVWDWRQKTSTKTFAENEDFISDMVLNNNELLCPSGDGTLSVFDLRKGVLEAMSDNMEDELLSIAIVKHGQKVVCGSQGGVVNIFKYGYWGDVNDRFPGHPESIDAIVKITENIIITGSTDGLIRVVSILPNKLIGVIGEHEDFPIERLKISRDSKILASSSHDNKVKFWDVSFFFGDKGEDSDSDESDNEKTDVVGLQSKMQKQKQKKHKPSKPFFSDL